MLFNLSNHPSTKWGDAQLDAARKNWVAVKDVAFPAIDPSATSRQVYDLARKFAHDIHVQFSAGDGVHLMGEQTFCTAFMHVVQEEKLGMPLFVSTTARDVVETADGKKVVTFKFVQFRSLDFSGNAF